MKIGITMLIHNKDDIEFVTEFPCFLGHPVHMFEESFNFDRVPNCVIFVSSFLLYRLHLQLYWT